MNARIHMATSIRLSAKAEQRLDFLAEQTGRTKAFYLRQMIENGLDDLEDYYLAADVLERVRKSEETTYSSAQVRADLGLDDSIHAGRETPTE
jgi:RHH-type rel operon transcriptional repressor/antitoxin RelB